MILIAFTSVEKNNGSWQNLPAVFCRRIWCQNNKKKQLLILRKVQSQKFDTRFTNIVDAAATAKKGDSNRDPH